VDASKGPTKHPFAKLIGLHYASRPALGQSACWLEAGEHLFNPGGVLHGGVVFSMADTGMGSALHSLLEPGQFTTTIEIKINYLLPVKTGRLDCVSRVIHKTARQGVVESNIRLGEDLVATALGTFAILVAKPRESARDPAAGGAR
jgi:acyl-CoA thioesterase